MAANSLDQPMGAAATLLWQHARNGWILLGMFFGTQFWKAWHRGQIPGPERYLYAVVILAAAGFAVFSAYLGAEMVYRHGVGVGV